MSHIPEKKVRTNDTTYNVTVPCIRNQFPQRLVIEYILQIILYEIELTQKFTQPFIFDVIKIISLLVNKISIRAPVTRKTYKKGSSSLCMDITFEYVNSLFLCSVYNYTIPKYSFIT